VFYDVYRYADCPIFALLRTLLARLIPGSARIYARVSLQRSVTTRGENCPAEQRAVCSGKIVWRPHSITDHNTETEIA
jgi:hypothetical protein